MGAGAPEDAGLFAEIDGLQGPARGDNEETGGEVRICVIVSGELNPAYFGN